MTVTTLAQAAEALRAPFPPGEEQYRAGPTWEQEGGRWTRPLAYIDARAVFERLDQAVGPDQWHTELERLAPGVYLCRLTILGVTRADVGQAGDAEGEKEKSGASDALKRAAVQFGIGRYLYERELPPARMERRGNDWALPRNWRPAASIDRTGAARQAPTPAADSGGERPAPAPSLSRGGLTVKQSGKIAHELARVGWDERRELVYLQRAYSKAARADLTSAEASQMIDHLLSLAPAERGGYP